MKLHLSNAAGLNLFTAHGDGYVAVNHEQHTGNLIVRPESIVTGWTEATAATLAAEDLQRLLELPVGIILLGTGNRLRFPLPQWLKPFAQAGIGLEIMDLPAACRTYNILANEGRQVAAALLFD
ncbi:MAG: Mth938-like domain-containing protein [Azonexus sp.]|uniref:Mth938-like domain-containing protein n=1 Tax=Azonexus sp. TaxID=1872668 RepID=UPI0028204A5E|nr:Mth938-like domain-containing protein [Azonexus sp.]MDR0775208.1 Mth938-like domain-containing protein [Azonexus sp.]